MNKILQIGNLSKSKRKNPNKGRVYSVKGIAPTVYNFAGGGGHGIWIIEANETQVEKDRALY